MFQHLLESLALFSVLMRLPGMWCRTQLCFLQSLFIQTLQFCQKKISCTSCQCNMYTCTLLSFSTSSFCQFFLWLSWLFHGLWAFFCSLWDTSLLPSTLSCYRFYCLVFWPSCFFSNDLIKSSLASLYYLHNWRKDFFKKDFIGDAFLFPKA